MMFRQERLEQSKALLFAKSSMSLLRELDKKAKIKKKEVLLTCIQFTIDVLCSVDVSEDKRKKMENERQGQVTDDGVKHECEDIFYKIVDIVEEAVGKEYPERSSDRVKELKVSCRFVCVKDIPGISQKMFTSKS